MNNLVRLHPKRPVVAQDSGFNLKILDYSQEGPEPASYEIELPIQEPFRFSEIMFSTPYKV